MKKILMTLPVFAFAMAFAASASASTSFPHWMFGNDELTVSSYNSAHIYNTTEAKSDTGDNSTSYNKGSGSGNILTGSALSVSASDLRVNSNMTTLGAPCDCFDDVTVTSTNNAFVMNKTEANAETGENTAMGNGGWWLFGGSDNGNILTGAASSGATSWTIVNSNVTGF